MATSPTELIRELEKAQIASRTLIEAVQRELIEQRTVNRRWEVEADALRRENAELRKELAELRQGHALTDQRLNDHLERIELWDSRRWGFITAIGVALFAACASFTSGLIIATLRK